MAAEDDSDIPDSGAVFTFGKSKFADNLPNKFWVRNDNVRDVACGDEHTALVAESGRVFTFGSNDWGQLGLGTSKTADRPSCIKSLKTEKVKLVACGRVHTIVATESGKIYSFGANGEGQLGVEDSPASNVPKCIDSLVEQQYCMLAAGADHSVALTEDGAVFVWGGGSEGQLGIEGKTECADPEELQIEDIVTCISCGYYHTAIVTESGDLLTFGESEGGKLGLGDDPDDTDKPQRVDISERVSAVACGGAHTVALTENGNVFTFGDGPSGQLGHGTHFLQIATPKKINVNFKVKAIACGENHTSLISVKGQLYTFGDGRHGKLGLGQDSFSNQFIPLKVKRFSKFAVEKVMCGGCHMICLAKLNRETDAMSSSEDELIGEPKMNGMLNHSLRHDGSIDLNNSVTARDRRRKTNESFKNDLNRTLPPLTGAHKVASEQLHQTVPAPKSRRIESTPLSKHTDSSLSGDDVQGEVIKAESREEVKSSPKALPRALPRRQAGLPPKKLEVEGSEEEEDEKEVEDEMEEEEEVEEMTQSIRTLPQAPIPPSRALPKIQVDESDEDADEEDEEDEEDKKTKKKKEKKPKKTKKGKKGGLGIFGRKKTGMSDDDAEEDEEDEEVSEKEEGSGDAGKTKGKKNDKKDKKKDKKDKKKDKKKKDDEDEDEEKDEDEEDEDNDKKKKGKKDKKEKDKKKDKTDKMKDKKKDKKEDEEDEDGSEEDEDENKDKKSKKKDKKKDKDKKKKDKDKDKDADKEGEKSGGEEKDSKTEEMKDNKEPEKPAEPPKKKSRTCTIL